ncbi:MAG TPA: hypothetical protein VGJ75_23140 [Dongiaceae bacterium]|jgi:hypothetical protein
MASPRPQTIPVFLLVRTAYQLLWQQRDDALRLGLIPTLICFGALVYGGDSLDFARMQFESGTTDQVPGDTFASLVVMLLILLVGASLVIANWLRFTLLGPMAAVGIGLNIGRTHVSFIISCVLLGFGASIAGSVLSMPLMLLPGVLKAIGFVVILLVVMIVVARLLPFAVAQAIGQPMSLQQAWSASRGNGVALATAMILVQVPMYIAATLLTSILLTIGFASAAPLAMTFVEAVFQIIDAVLIAIVLATAFRQMVGIRV